MILVDSSVWIDVFNGRTTRETDLLAHLLPQHLVLIGDLVMVEVLQGFRRQRELERAERALDELPYADLAGRDPETKPLLCRVAEQDQEVDVRRAALGGLSAAVRVSKGAVLLSRIRNAVSHHCGPLHHLGGRLQQAGRHAARG